MYIYIYISTLKKNKDAKTNSPAAFSLPWAKLVDHQLLATSQRTHHNHHLPAAIREPTERNVMGKMQPRNPPAKRSSLISFGQNIHQLDSTNAHYESADLFKENHS